MRFGLSVANIGEYADARLVAGLARDAEDAEWDGLFVWDHLVFVKAWRPEVGDAWTILAAVALATHRLRLGPMVTPLPRRRPQVVARQTTTLDRLSGGRLVFGAGLGEPAEDEFGSFGEPTDRRTRAAMLDEGLEVLAALWSGEAVTHHGAHYTVDDVTFLPRPIQVPRIPVWIAATVGHERPLRRAARWDGVHPVKYGPDGEDLPLTPEDVASMFADVRRFRTEAGLPEAGLAEAGLPGAQPAGAPFDVVALGEMDPSDRVGTRHACAELAAAGATWWLQAVSPRGGDVETMRRLVRAGPPR
jgi:alkanesulfonate monooxygenase SsuD/methylene tetrahydromethanopterin reductase-like flavin-dependent oxidoreductase (luciferase family)